MDESIQELEKRLKKIEDTSEKKDIEEKLAQEMKDYKGIDEVIHFKDVQEIKSDHVISTGLKPLDKLIEGFHDGDLIVVTAEPGQGKTTLLQTFTINLSKQGIKTLWFSYENTVPSLILKFGTDLPDGYVPKTLVDKSLIWIQRKIVEAKAKFGIKAVIIDPFNSLTKFSSPNLSQELGDIAEELKQIAIKYNIFILVSAHANTVQEEIMSLKNIRDTRLLGSKADTVIAMWRIKQKQKRLDLQQNGELYTNETILSLIKNRLLGYQGSVKVIHSGNKFLLPDYSIEGIQEEESNQVEEEYVSF